MYVVYHPCTRVGIYAGACLFCVCVCVHWPSLMYTFVEKPKGSFTNNAVGQLLSFRHEWLNGEQNFESFTYMKTKTYMLRRHFWAWCHTVATVNSALYSWEMAFARKYLYVKSHYTRQDVIKLYTRYFFSQQTVQTPAVYWHWVS
jgi:hypothetical protein